MNLALAILAVPIALLWIGYLAPGALLFGGAYWVFADQDGRRLRRVAVWIPTTIIYIALARLFDKGFAELGLPRVDMGDGIDLGFQLASAVAAIIVAVGLSGLREVLALWLGHPLSKGFVPLAGGASEPGGKSATVDRRAG